MIALACHHQPHDAIHNPNSEIRIRMPANHRQTDRKFLGVHYVNCRAYGRLYLDRAGTAYVGRCPRCGAIVRARVGENGIDCRFFLATCGK